MMNMPPTCFIYMTDRMSYYYDLAPSECKPHDLRWKVIKTDMMVLK